MILADTNVYHEQQQNQDALFTTQCQYIPTQQKFVSKTIELSAHTTNGKKGASAQQHFTFSSAATNTYIERSISISILDTKKASPWGCQHPSHSDQLSKQKYPPSPQAFRQHSYRLTMPNHHILLWHLVTQRCMQHVESPTATIEHRRG